MNRFFKWCAIVTSLAILTGCAEPRKLNGDGVEYPTYGMLNEASNRSDSVCYRMSVGNVILSVIFSETVVIPVYLIGFSLYEPVRFAESGDHCSFHGAHQTK